MTRQGLTLVEVLISLGVLSITLVSILAGYLYSAREAERATCATAAEFAVLQRIEQTRAAKWDRLASPPVDEVVSNNFPTVISPLDIPVAGTNVLYGTNYTTIATVSEEPPLKLIRVDCVWSFQSRRPVTNTVAVYRSPDQ